MQSYTSRVQEQKYEAGNEHNSSYFKKKLCKTNNTMKNCRFVSHQSYCDDKCFTRTKLWIDHSSTLGYILALKTGYMNIAQYGVFFCFIIYVRNVKSTQAEARELFFINFTNTALKKVISEIWEHLNTFLIFALAILHLVLVWFFLDPNSWLTNICAFFISLSLSLHLWGYL